MLWVAAGAGMSRRLMAVWPACPAEWDPVSQSPELCDTILGLVSPAALVIWVKRVQTPLPAVCETIE